LQQREWEVYTLGADRIVTAGRGQAFMRDGVPGGRAVELVGIVDFLKSIFHMAIGTLSLGF
jgi:hypothetical protein